MKEIWSRKKKNYNVKLKQKWEEYLSHKTNEQARKKKVKKQKINQLT